MQVLSLRTLDEIEQHEEPEESERKEDEHDLLLEEEEQEQEQEKEEEATTVQGSEMDRPTVPEDCRQTIRRAGSRARSHGDFVREAMQDAFGESEGEDALGEDEDAPAGMVARAAAGAAAEFTRSLGLMMEELRADVINPTQLMSRELPPGMDQGSTTEESWTPVTMHSRSNSDDRATACSSGDWPFTGSEDPIWSPRPRGAAPPRAPALAPPRARP